MSFNRKLTENILDVPITANLNSVIDKYIARERNIEKNNKTNDWDYLQIVYNSKKYSWDAGMIFVPFLIGTHFWSPRIAVNDIFSINSQEDWSLC